MIKNFMLAPMDRLLFTITTFMFVGPACLFIYSFKWPMVFAMVPFSFVLLFYSAYLVIWLWFRPRCFLLSSEVLQIRWPLRKKEWLRSEITHAEVLSGADFRRKYGRGMRIGAGGVWGGFGWLKTKSQMFHMYISRVDSYVLVHFRSDIPLLITPNKPMDFVTEIHTVK